jgi:hypothetical protein
MPDIDRSGEIMDGEAKSAAQSPCVDVVPVDPPVQWLRRQIVTRPDPSFIAQLIATAEQAPQTRSLRRATYADAQIAYGLHPQERRGIARRTRQII